MLYYLYFCEKTCKMKQCILLLLLIASIYANGQEDMDSERAPFYVSASFQVGIPQNDFYDVLNKVGIGGGGAFFFRIRKDMPFYAGLDLSVVTYDAESDFFFDDFGEFELETRANIFLGHGVLRFEPELNIPIQFYLDGMFGFKNLYNRTKAIDTDTREEDTLDSSGDWAFSYGGAAGIQIPIGQDGAIMLDARCAFLRGTVANYLVRREDLSGVQVVDPIDVFEEKTSSTDVLLPQIGLTFSFGWNNNEAEQEDEIYEEVYEDEY